MVRQKSLIPHLVGGGKGVERGGCGQKVHTCTRFSVAGLWGNLEFCGQAARWFVCEHKRKATLDLTIFSCSASLIGAGSATSIVQWELVLSSLVKHQTQA